MEAIPRLVTRATAREKRWAKVDGDTCRIFAVVGCEISITRVPEVDSIIEAGLITDSIVATSASRNLFLFALKHSPVASIMQRDPSAHACALALSDTFPRVTPSRHIVLSRGHPV